MEELTDAPIQEEVSKPLMTKKEEKSESSQFVSLRLAKRKLVALIIVLILVIVTAVVWQKKLYQPILDRYNAASVTLKVREGQTFALAGAVIKLDGKTYTTGSDGKLIISHIVAGKYTAQVHKDGYADAQPVLQIHRGNNDLQFIALTKLPEKVYSLKGLLQDEVSGQPLVNVEVTFGSQTVKTDPSGAYHFDKVVPGAVKLHFSKGGFISQQLDQKVVDTDLVVPPTLLVPVGQLIFVSNRNGTRNLYTTNYDGSNQTIFDVAAGGGEDFAPLLSPTNQQVAFSSTRDKVKDSFGNDLVHLYVADKDGSNLKKVSNDVASSITPIWSPSGQYLYYTAYTTPEVNQSTHQVYSLAKNSLIDLGEQANSVVFSPDSTTIAYYVVSTIDQPVPADAPSGAPTETSINVIKTLNLVTGERKTLAQRPQFLSDLRFNATNDAVSYEVIVDSVRHRFQTALATPNQETEVPVIPLNKRNYALSPDGKSQAFIEERDGKTDLYVVDKDGNNEKRLTTLGALEDTSTPLWSDNGQYLIFTVKREAENAYYIVSLNGGDPKKVTDYYTEAYDIGN